MRSYVWVTASGTAIARRARLKRLVLTASSTAAATAELRRGSSTGPVLLTVGAPTAASFATELDIEAEGSLYVTLGGSPVGLYVEYE